MAERQLLDNVPLQWLLRFARTPIIVPIEALLVALTSDVAVNVVSTNRRRMAIGRAVYGLACQRRAKQLRPQTMTRGPTLCRGTCRAMCRTSSNHRYQCWAA
jgi:hypothetical protein